MAEKKMEEFALYLRLHLSKFYIAHWTSKKHWRKLEWKEKKNIYVDKIGLYLKLLE